MTYREAIEIVEASMIRIRDTNDHVIEATKNLDIILINLRIENAHLNQATGITPIADALRRIIDEMRNEVTSLVSDGRSKLTEALGVIKLHSMEEEKRKWLVV